MENFIFDKRVFAKLFDEIEKLYFVGWDTVVGYTPCRVINLNK